MGGAGGPESRGAARLTNVFITPEQLRGDRVFVTGGDAFHLARVLRLGPGDRFRALDGTGLEYEARIVSAAGDLVEALVESRAPRLTEARLRVTLGQALPKGDKMEQVIRKCTELGLAAFWPLRSERCVAVPSGEREAGRLARWRRVAAEAARQSGRGEVPEVAAIKTWTEAAGSFEGFDLVLLPWEGEIVTTLKDVLTARDRPERVLVLVGPEGGLTQTEATLAREAGAVAVTLGPRILRTETAGLVVGAALFYHYDELVVSP